MGKDNLIRSFLGIITFSLLVFLLGYLSELLIPFSIATIFFILFSPFIDFLNKKKIPSSLSLIIVLVVLAFSFYFFGVILYSSSKPLIHGLPQYEEKISQIINALISSYTVAMDKIGLEIGSIDIKTLVGVTTTTADTLSQTLSTFLSFLGNSGMVMLFLIFMLASKGNLVEKIKMAYPKNSSSEIIEAFGNISTQIRRYIVVIVIINALTALLTYIVVWMLGVDYPLFWCILSFLVCFIPNIGAVIAIGAPFMLSLIQFDTLTIPIALLVLLGLVYALMGSFITPKFMASNLNLSALLIIVSLIFWGLVWGPWGMVLAIPLTTIIKIIFAHVNSLKPISILMGSKTKK